MYTVVIENTNDMIFRLIPKKKNNETRMISSTSW